MSKLIVVTRGDLPIGVQATQAAHAAIEFCLKYHSTAVQWSSSSKVLVVAVVSSEADLQGLCVEAMDLGIRIAEFREPDLGDQLTAVALSPDQRCEKLVRKLPLAFAS